jgi:hypothetical protein
MKMMKQPQSGASRIFKRGLLIFVGFWGVVFALYITIVFFAQPMENWDTASNYNVKPGAYFILVHWIGGTITLLSGHFQFLSGVRQKYPAFHHWNGRFFLLGCSLAVVGGELYALSTGTVGGITMDISFIFYGVIISVFSVSTFYFAYQRRIQQHRRW